MLDIDKIIIAKTEHLIEVYGFTIEDIEHELGFFWYSEDFRNDTEEEAFYSLCDELKRKHNLPHYAAPLTEFNEIVTKVLINKHNKKKQNNETDSNR